MIEHYLREFKSLRAYVIWIPIVIIATFCIYFLDDDWILKLCEEENLIELLTAFCFLICSILFLLTFLKNRNIWILLLALLFFFGAGEEVSWGQRIIGFETPEEYKKINIQHEFTIHNIGAFQRQSGLGRLIEINFLFRLFFCTFGVLLPFATYHISAIKKLVRKVRMPVPPFAIGIFFIIAWTAHKTLYYLLPPGHVEDYYVAVGEMLEFFTSFIFLMIALYFYNNRNKDIMGIDYKDLQA